MKSLARLRHVAMAAAVGLMLPVPFAAPAAAQVYTPPPPQVYNNWQFHNTRNAIVMTALARKKAAKRAAARRAAARRAAARR